MAQILATPTKPAPPKFQGSVILQIVVTADGRAENIFAVKGPGSGLVQQAIETVRTWRFKPAHGPDGAAVASSVPVLVAFRLN
jgi:TonB family protein